MEVTPESVVAAPLIGPDLTARVAAEVMKAAGLTVGALRIGVALRAKTCGVERGWRAEPLFQGLEVHAGNRGIAMTTIGALHESLPGGVCGGVPGRS